jgi:hypothetical protein
MFNKRLCASLAAALTLAACGGGDDNKLSREYGLLLLVNGSQVITDRTLTQIHYDREDRPSLEDCLFTAKNANLIDIEVPIYDNYETLGGEASPYCDGEQVAVTQGLVFQIRFYNNTYDDLPITFRGAGVEVRIYNESDEEVWNSLIVDSTTSFRYGLGTFDPFKTNALTLKAQEAYPVQRNTPLGYLFSGERNYADSDQDPTTYNYEADLQAVGWNNSNPSQSQCELALELKAGTRVDDMDTPTDPSDDVTRPYQKPFCQTNPLPPGLYRVRVEYSFTPYIEPVEFYVNLVAGSA